MLIDTGSNNNFIQEALADKLRLQQQDTKRFKVYMGNGNYLLCSKVCKQVELLMQGHRFMVDLYVLPITGLNVVLGMQWLQTLGPCIHDHKALTMEFKWQGNVVKLAGSQDVHAQQLSYAQFHALVREGDVSAMYRFASVSQEISADSTTLQSMELSFPLHGQRLFTSLADVFSEPQSLPPTGALTIAFFFFQVRPQ